MGKCSFTPTLFWPYWLKPLPSSPLAELSAHTRATEQLVRSLGTHPLSGWGPAELALYAAGVISALEWHAAVASKVGAWPTDLACTVGHG